MASNSQDLGGRDIFQETEIIINETFGQIINKVKSRRDVLLLELDNLKTEYASRNRANTDSLHELDGMRVQLEQLAIKQNFALTVQNHL